MNAAEDIHGGRGSTGEIPAAPTSITYLIAAVTPAAARPRGMRVARGSTYVLSAGAHRRST
jgi:hypothetical protein